MSTVNKAFLIGYLGQDPEIRYMNNGDAVANFNIATTQRWKDKASGEQREETEWHRIVLYRRTAEIAGEYLKKGAHVCIQGRIRTRKWQDREGQDRYTTEIIGEELQMLGRAGGRDQDTEREEHRAAPERPEKREGVRGTKAGGHGEPARGSILRGDGGLSEMEDDIPF